MPLRWNHLGWKPLDESPAYHILFSQNLPIHNIRFIMERITGTIWHSFAESFTLAKQLINYLIYET